MPVPLANLLHRLRRLSITPEADSDTELLRRFARDRDDDAFTMLVAQHGSMVFNCCRRALGDADDADDACQATFLVLARRAGSVRRP
jgi:DNA-directed RNA polymerase specialized sigma24 family protein